MTGAFPTQAGCCSYKGFVQQLKPVIYEFILTTIDFISVKFLAVQ